MGWPAGRRTAALLSQLALLLLLARQADGLMQKIAGGNSHSCAVLELELLKCWGYNSDGQLGYGDIIDRGGAPADMGANLTYVDLGNGQSVATVALGRAHSCALLTSGAVKCWGGNQDGQLGLGDRLSRGNSSNEMGDNLPAIDLGTGRTAIAIATGATHNCALLDNHDIKCWGDNYFGQLGLGDSLPRGDEPGKMGDNLPTVDLGTDFTAVAIAAGDGYTCALSDAGHIKCWGYNSYGQLGQGDTQWRGSNPGEMGDNLPPIDLGSGNVAVAIAVGDHHTCALLASGMIKCWGRNYFGVLGYGDKITRGVSPDQMGDNLPPVDLGTSRTAIAVESGAIATCALLDDGSMKCWGFNTDGQLGQEDNDDRGDDPNEMGDHLAPIKLGTGRTAKSIAVGGFHVLALLDDGTLKAWGRNNFGQLGLGHLTSVGAEVGTMGDNLTAVDLGGDPFPVCALGSFGEWSCDECPAGTWALAGAVSLSECVMCKGGYAPLPGATQCIACAPGTVSSVEGATSDTCEPCIAGKYSLYAGATACTDCAAGTYSNMTGASSQETCNLCPVGKSSAVIGASSADTCDQCVAGRYADIPGSSECRDCDPGRYSDLPGASAPGLCRACPAGRASSNAGADSEADCQPCAAGRYADVGATECVACAAGRYSHVPEGTSNYTCTACPTGTWSSTEGLDSPVGCVPCTAGRYSTENGAASEGACVPCEPGTYSSLMGADQCQECPAGRFAEEAGKTSCDGCLAGKYSSYTGAESCDTCVAGTYSMKTYCANCPAGKTSARGSGGVDECESMTSSFAVGGLLLLVTIVVVLVYIVGGRAATVASKERQLVLLPIIHACANISAHILATMKRRQENGGLLQILLVMLLTIAVFVTAVLAFVTNTFLLSRSFFAAPEWVEAFGEQIESLVQSIPPLGFLSVVPPIVKFIESIEFVDLLDGMEVTCSGAQAPLVLLMNALIVIGTIVMIDSQLHTVMALALGPAVGLTRDKLISMPDTSFMMRARNMLRFLILLVVSSFFHSFSRYTMQVFATLINYADFLPFHEWSRGCNSGEKIDELLATASTVFFYVAAIPMMLLVIPVMMPGLSKRGGESGSFKRAAGQSEQRGVDQLRNEPVSEAKAPSTQRTVFQRLLDCINPFRWLLFGVDWLLKSLYGHAAMEQPDKRQIASDDLVQHNAVEEAEVLGCTALLKSCCARFWCSHCTDRSTPCKIISTCLWKLRLSVYLAFGVWTDEIVQSLRVDEIAQQHFGWTADHTRSYEDVMAAAGPMRSMVWMLVPGTIVLTKLSEATNNPPVFVRSGLVKMTSPVLFGSWREAEEVMLEGLVLLNNRANDVSPDFERWQPGCATAFEHHLLVMLVWIFGARLPQYLVNITVLVLAVSAALHPTSGVLMAAVCILFPWAVLYALAVVSDVMTMLRLRKLAGSSGSLPRQRFIEMPTVEVNVSPADMASADAHTTDC